MRRVLALAAAGYLLYALAGARRAKTVSDDARCAASPAYGPSPIA